MYEIAFILTSIPNYKHYIKGFDTSITAIISTHVAM